MVPQGGICVRHTGGGWSGARLHWREHAPRLRGGVRGF